MKMQRIFRICFFLLLGGLLFSFLRLPAQFRLEVSYGIFGLMAAIILIVDVRRRFKEPVIGRTVSVARWF